MKRERKKLFGIRTTRLPGQARKQLDDYRRRLTSASPEEDQYGSTGDDAFMKDAADGVEALNRSVNLDEYLSQLNAELARNTGRKTGKTRRPVKSILNLPLIILIILLLLLLAYWVVFTGIKPSI